MLQTWYSKITAIVLGTRSQIQATGIEGDHVLIHERACGHVAVTAEDVPADVTVIIKADVRCGMCSSPKALASESAGETRVHAEDEKEAKSICAALLASARWDKGAMTLDDGYVARRLAAWRQSGGR